MKLSSSANSLTKGHERRGKPGSAPGEYDRHRKAKHKTYTALYRAP